MTAAKDAARTVLALLTCWGARFSSARAGIALVYHRIGDTAGNPHFEILPAVSSDVFDRQLRHLRRRYRVVPATELLEAVRERRRGERFPASITFDDDLASHLEDAVPALQREGLPATFFLGGVSLREPHPLWWEDLQKAIDERLVQPDALLHVAEADLRSALERSPKAIFRVAATIEQLGQSEREETAVELRAAVGPAARNDGLRTDHVRSLVGAGFDVGFHTFRHDLLPGLSDTALAEAMREGREELERVTGRPLDVISYPYGKADDRVAQAARKAGFTRGFTTNRTSVGEETDPLLIPRIPPAMSFGKTALRLARAVAPGHDRPMSGDADRLKRENDLLTKDVRELRARLAAVESSRWWRLHPRVALEHLRARFRSAEDGDAIEPEPRGAHAFPMDFEEADVELCLRVAPYTMTTPARIYSLVRAVEYVSGRALPGAFVECGVWRGGSMMAVALTLLRLGVTDRDLYLFDTFTGMTAPSDEDVRRSGERAADLLAEQSRSSDIWAIAAIEDVREAVLSVGYPEERIHFVQGPVEETLPASAPEQIALLRLDTDWYSSTKHELVHLFPRLTTGGVLILDDYGYWQGARRAVDEYLTENGLSLLLNRIDNTARIALKP